jgi:ribosomal protein S18 acetylase RimI-like enzyme
MNHRSYETADADELWELKRGFETGLGEAGSEDKETAYAEKLTEEYRTRWLGWVAECTDENPRAVTVAEAPDDEYDLAGYVFLLPESLAYIWDAAVLNEIYVRPEYRGTSVGNELMSAAVGLANEQDLPLDRLVLDVDRENERARAFYEKHGFEHWGEMVARPLEGDEADSGASVGQ